MRTSTLPCVEHDCSPPLLLCLRAEASWPFCELLTSDRFGAGLRFEALSFIGCLNQLEPQIELLLAALQPNFKSAKYSNLLFTLGKLTN